MKNKEGINAGNVIEDAKIAIGITIGFSAAEVKYQLARTAESLGIDAELLTQGVAALLYRETVRKGLGRSKRMPKVQSRTSKTRAYKRSQKKVDASARRKSPKIKNRGSGIRAYWANMSVAERKAEMARRGLLRQKKAA